MDGGDHSSGGGGFTSGSGDYNKTEGINGLAPTEDFYHVGQPMDYGDSIGAGYYTYTDEHSSEGNYQMWFGEGGCWFGLNFGANGWSSAGNGGIAGCGGKVKYSNTATIHAYNGDLVTNGVYSNVYDYDKDGKRLNLLNSTTKINGDVFIPARIFAQDGIRRAVYDNICYMSESDRIKYKVNGEIDDDRIRSKSANGNVMNVRILDEEKIEFFKQGIGSGAGYIEVSNGTYTVDPKLN